MVHYNITNESSNLQFLKIEAVFETKADETKVDLASWRPGRYELGNFAKNIKNIRFFSDQKKPLRYHKISKDTWLVDTKGTSKIMVSYHFYAAELNAGSTFINQNLVYVNPVNCFLFTEETKADNIELTLNIPEDWMVAAATKRVGHQLWFQNYEELADTPFMCAPHFHYNQYESHGVIFHIWINGELKPDWKRLITDFKKFTDKQISTFTEFPTDEYHFLIHLLPYKSYHGVEHSKSTVITLGPTHQVFSSLYKELLGVSSHELYHTWNVKHIRPIEMFPYDFKKENYSELGYIYEGVTTYMGDLFLLKSKVFSLENYLLEMNAQLQKHFDNPGRFNYSVAQSSFDTWLDGYVPGVPGRKVSIYTEGCLLAFVMDVKILEATQFKFGLDEVMRVLYFDYTLKGKGISEADYKKVLTQISSLSWDDFFDQYIHGTNSYETILTEAFDTLGLELIHQPNKLPSASKLGFKYVPNQDNCVVKTMYPGGPAELAGLQLEDEIIAVNDFLLKGELEQWLNQFEHEIKKFTVIRMGKLVDIQIPEVQRNFYNDYSVKAVAKPDKNQMVALRAWMK